MNDHEFMKKRSKALTEPLPKTSSFLKTIFHDFWTILASQNEAQKVDTLTILASKPLQGLPKPPQTSPGTPPGGSKGTKKLPKTPSRRSPKHPKDAKKGSKVFKIP